MADSAELPDRIWQSPGVTLPPPVRFSPILVAAKSAVVRPTPRNIWVEVDADAEVARAHLPSPAKRRRTTRE